MRKEDAFEIGRLDAHGQAALVQSGQVSGVELVEAAIVRIEHLDPVLNVTTHRVFDEARARAAKVGKQSGLSGVPYLLKDGLDYPGMPTRSGSRIRANSQSVTVEYDYSRRLDRAGLIPLGKTNVSEFGLLPTTESLLYGPARNPWALDRSPGGSSGGAGVAVASGMVALAHAADGGGSIRIPASCCGLVGLKPGRGANVRARGRHFIEDLLVGDILLSRSVRDAAWAFSVARPGDVAPVDVSAPLKRLRVGVITANLSGDMPHPNIARVVQQGADLCSELGHAVEEAAYPFDAPAVAASFRTIWGYLARDTVEYCKSVLRSGSLEDVLEPWTLKLAHWSQRQAASDLEAAMDQMARTSVGLENLFKRCDVVLSPVLKEPPVPIGRLAPTREFEPMLSEMFEYISYTPLHNLAGTPAISVPLFMMDGLLPIGSMFAAAKGGECMLLQLAHELEQARPWASRWPLHSR